MEEYADNKETKGIKIFFFLRNGISLLNEFKNYLEVILVAYFTLKFSSLLWLIPMFGIGTPLLILVGWLCATRWNKVLEYLAIKHGTHYSIKQFQIQEEILNTLKEINKKL